MLVEFYRSQDAGRKPCLDIAKQILDQLNIKDLAVVHLSLAAEIAYLWYMAQSCDGLKFKKLSKNIQLKSQPAK